MSTYTLQLKLEDTKAILNQKYKLATEKSVEQIKVMENLMKAVACGQLRATALVQTSDTSPVASSGTLTLVSAIATDEITIGTVTMTATSTPTLATHWEIDGADDAADALSLATAINANPTLGKVVVATVASNVVTITALQKGVVGNQIPISSADATITASGAFLTGGTGGVEDAGTSYAFGL